MSEVFNHLYDTIDKQESDKSAATRRQVVAGAAATFGAMGMLSVPSVAGASHRNGHVGVNTPENIINLAATVEVLATIVNTVGFERGLGGDAQTQANLESAAREELIHYQVLTSQAVGAKAVTTKIHVPDEVFANRTNFLQTVIAGDQIFINAYLLGVTVFARAGTITGSRFSRFAAEFMAVEQVHRALALQSLGRLGNDRAFAKFAQREETPEVLTTGQPGFYEITDAVKQLEAAGFGFGKAGSKPGQLYDFAEVSKRTPNPPSINTRSPS